jgi:hypothetical protein
MMENALRKGILTVVGRPEKKPLHIIKNAAAMALIRQINSLPSRA